MFGVHQLTSTVRSVAGSFAALVERFDEAEEVWEPFFDDDDLPTSWDTTALAV